MGVTPKYAFPWPEITGLVKDGAASIRQLAEHIEAVLLPPLLVTDGAGDLNWTNKAAEIPWDVSDNPDRKRGNWDSIGQNERLIFPPWAGYYFVAASVRFGGKSEPDTYQLGVTTRVQDSTPASGFNWGMTRIELPANSTDFSQLSIATIVRVPTTSPRTGVAIEVHYKGTNQPPAIGTGLNKLRIHYLSAL